MIEEVQTEIKLIIRNNILGGKSFIKLDREVQRKIKEVVRELDDELKFEASQTLNMFADKVFRQFISDLGFDYSLLLGAVASLQKGVFTDKELEVLNSDIKSIMPVETALPLQEYHKTYIDKVKTALNNMRQIEANTTSGASLRNIAEMQVRYERHINSQNELRERGENLVVCSTHANCSERCENWQGGYYTLDGTTQTVDGKEFIPLETATNVFVTTKAGKVYKNGLFGFNCRHYLLPYRNEMLIPHTTAEEIDKERNIDKRMRQLERNVRQWREEAVLNKGVDKRRYLKSREKAIEWNKRYIEFAKTNERAYYPDRTKII